MLSISNFHSLHIELFLLLHSRAGFWEGCDLEYVSSPPGGWREGWKYSQDALPDGQSLRYYRVALCRLCVLAECPRLAHVFVIRKIRPRACGVNSPRPAVWRHRCWLHTWVSYSAEDSARPQNHLWTVCRYLWWFPAHESLLPDSMGLWGQRPGHSRVLGKGHKETAHQMSQIDAVSVRVSLPGPFKLEQFHVFFPCCMKCLSPIDSYYVWILVPSSVLCVLTLPTSLSESLGLEHKLLTDHALASTLLEPILFHISWRLSTSGGSNIAEVWGTSVGLCLTTYRISQPLCWQVWKIQI